MNIEAIESSVVTRLAALNTTSTSVVPLPEKPKDFSKSKTKRLVTIAVNSGVSGDFGKEDDPVISTGIIVQNESIKIVAICQAGKLRGDGGLYQLINSVRSTLVGFAPTNCDKMFVRDFGISEGNTEKDKWAWTHVIRFECKTMVVEDHDGLGDPVAFDTEGNPIYPDATSLSANSDFGNSNSIQSEKCNIVLSKVNYQDRLDCVLPTFDFSDDDVFNSLTQDQKDQLTQQLSI